MYAHIVVREQSFTELKHVLRVHSAIILYALAQCGEQHRSVIRVIREEIKLYCIHLTTYH